MHLQPYISLVAARSICRQSCSIAALPVFPATIRAKQQHLSVPATRSCILPCQIRSLSSSGCRLAEQDDESFKAKNLDDAIGEEKEKQQRTPWHREGSELSPVKRPRSAGAMTKGKLLSTPSRLLKLVVPLTTLDKNSDRKDVEPLALLVHPQQPLSYLERLIQSELPTMRNAKGEQKIPHVYFRAQDSGQDSMMPPKKQSADQEGDLEEEVSEAQEIRGGPGEGGVETYSGLGHENPEEQQRRVDKFVRWSASTEVGDFIREAARGKEFAIEIEGAHRNIRVGVPSFNDRTHYLRMRLRKTSRQIADMATIKHECDLAAHKGGQRVAMGGFGLMVVWWYVVYWCTFETELTWDVMEPVTYLVGLGTVMGGYLWFLYHNREASYRSAMNLTVSRRQTKLYQSRNFDLQKWATLIEEGNGLRKEIKAVADEYDVEWDEKSDEFDDSVVKALSEDRSKKRAGREKSEQKRKRKDGGEEEEEDD